MSTYTPTNKALSRGVTLLGRHWYACPSALWDPMARPADKHGNAAKLNLGNTVSLREALSTEHWWDAHIAAYVVVDPSGKVVGRPPRLSKAGLAELLRRGFTVLFGSRWADIDEPDHRALSDERWALYDAILRRYPCAYYRTRGGVRVVQSLTRLLGPEEYEVCIRSWLRELRLLMASVPGIVVDPNCSDWTREMRLPRVLRDDNGVITNTWATAIQVEGLTLQDPGDCRPPIRIVIPKPVIHTDRNTRYGQASLDNALTTISSAPAGDRHTRIYRTAAGIGSLVSGGELQECLDALLHVCPEEHERACREGYAKGLLEPRQAPNRPLDVEALRKKLISRIEADESGDISL